MAPNGGGAGGVQVPLPRDVRRHPGGERADDPAGELVVGLGRPGAARAGRAAVRRRLLAAPAGDPALRRGAPGRRGPGLSAARAGGSRPAAGAGPDARPALGVPAIIGPLRAAFHPRLRPRAGPPARRTAPPPPTRATVLDICPRAPPNAGGPRARARVGRRTAPAGAARAGGGRAGGRLAGRGGGGPGGAGAPARGAVPGGPPPLPGDGPPRGPRPPRIPVVIPARNEAAMITST